MADVAGFDVVQFDYIPEDEVFVGGSGKSFAPPPEGKYFGQAPMITEESFGQTQEKYLKVNLGTITIINPGGPGDGYEVRFASLSGKKYSNRNTSQVIEFLRACGISQTPKDADEAKAMLKMCSGKTFQFALQWKAYDTDAQKETVGMDKFPLLDDGTHQPWLDAEFDKTKRVFANGRVRFYISAVGK